MKLVSPFPTTSPQDQFAGGNSSTKKGSSQRRVDPIVWLTAITEFLTALAALIRAIRTRSDKMGALGLRLIYDVKRQASEMLMSGCASLLPLQLFLRERLLQTAGPSQSIAGRLRERNNWP